MVRSYHFSVTPLYHIIQRVMRLCRPLCLAVPLWVASTGMVNAESWKVNLQDADIKAFINEVATITNQNFVLDPRINGNVTVISNKPLSRDEIYQLFLSVMQVNGIAAIDSGTTIKLVPDNVAKQTGVAVDLRGESVGEALATRVIYLTNTQAAEVLGVIRPLMPQSAHAAAVPGVNALVLSDRADSLNQLTALIRDLDSNVNDSLQVIPLRHVDAERMMELISVLVASAGSGQAQGGNNQLKVIADTASDRLLVKGSPEMIAKVKEMVNQLDTTPTRRLSGLRVFRLKYASAGHIAEMLRGLLASQSINSAGTASTLESASLNNGAATGATLNTGASGSVANNSVSNTGASALPNNSSSGSSIGGRPFSIIADETQNAVIVNAAPELMFEIEDAVNQLDSRRAQVLIQAAIVEVSGDDATQLGVQWALGNANSGYGVVNFNNVGASAVSLAAAALSGGTGISAAAGSIAGALLGIGSSSKDSKGNAQFYGAILQALDSSTSANLLSMPSILTLDNEKASILVGQNVPFVTGSYTTGSDSSTNPFQTIDRQDIGINLNVIPHIGENGTVRLEVSQEVSSVVPGSAGNASGLITNKSLINTTILADDQQTIALGGLMRDNSTTRQQKVPGLGNVPLIGRLFRSDNDNSQKSNLIIFLQPTILRDGGAVASVTERKYNQMRVLQLVIDKNGTIKQLPLSGTEGWNGDVSADYELMPLNPLIPKRDQTPKVTSKGFTRVDSPSTGITTYPLNR